MPVPLATKPAAGSTINTGHSLASGLVRCILFNEGSGSPKELVGAGAGTLNGGAAWATDTNLGGTSMDSGSSGTDAVNWGTGGLSYGNGNCTFFIGARIPVNAAKEHTAIETGGVAVDRIFCGVQNNGLFKLTVADVAHIQSTFTPTAGDVYTLGVGYTRATSARFHIKNQTTDVTQSETINDTSVPLTGTTISTTNNRHDLGTPSGGNWDERIAFIYVWNRVLSDAEFASLHSNPYQFITPPGSSLMFPRWGSVRR